MELMEKTAMLVKLLHQYLKYFFDDIADKLTGKPVLDPLTGVDFMMQQLREMLIMAACGACIAFMFQAYNGCVKRCSLKRLLVRRALVITDIIFCIIAGVIIAKFWFRSSYGRLSVHEALGTFIGLAVGMRTFAFGKSKRRHTIAVIYVILIMIAYFVIS